MKRTVRFSSAALLALVGAALVGGRAAADPPANTTQIDCPTLSPSVVISAGGTWTPKPYSASHQPAHQNHREPGVGRDSLWCTYRFDDPQVGNAVTWFQIVRNAPGGFPACENAPGGQKAFICRALLPGQSY